MRQSQSIRAALFASIAGIVGGLLMALDPLLPVLHITAPRWVWMVLTPSIIIFRLLMLFGPIAVLSGGLAGYRVTRRSGQRRLGIVASGLIGLGVLVANLVFFSTLFFLLLHYRGLHPILEARAAQLLGFLELAPAGQDTSLLSPATLVLGGVVVCTLGLFNLLLALVSGAIGSWLAAQQATAEHSHGQP
jgi:hypothetical protein